MVVMVNWPLFASLLIPNAGGWLSALTAGGQVRSRNGQPAWYETINKPSWNPPNWVFGPAWTIIYTAMGYASYIVYKDCSGFNEYSALPLALYAVQLGLNWTWSPVFFKFHKIGLALIHMTILDMMATACTVSFAIINKNTLYFMTPYLCWLAFATSLNYTIRKLNRYEHIDDKREF